MLPLGSAGLEGGGPTGLTLGTVGATGLGAGEGSLGLTTLGGAASGFAVGGGSTGMTTGTVEEGTGRGAGRGLFPPLEAGLDSLGAIELRTNLSAHFKIDLPSTVTFDYPSIVAISAFIASQIPSGDHTVDMIPSMELQEMQRPADGSVVLASSCR